MVKKMSKKVVILHGSPRVSGNSDILAKEFKKGSEDAGNEVKKISFPMRFINYCKGCLGCVSSGECVIHDDVRDFGRYGRCRCYCICKSYLF